MHLGPPPPPPIFHHFQYTQVKRTDARILCCRHVRKAAVQLLSIAAHNKVDLVREGLPKVVPALYAQTAQDPSMIRIVELGPFQHKIDDGLELRKAAFECMDVLLEKTTDRLSLPDFIHHLQTGLDVRTFLTPSPPLEHTLRGWFMNMLRDVTSDQLHIFSCWESRHVHSTISSLEPPPPPPPVISLS